METTTKYIGILELGSLSTAFYMKELKTLFAKFNIRNREYPFKLLKSNFNEINALLPEPSLSLEIITQRYIHQFLQLGVNAIIIPNITLHETVDSILKNNPFPVYIIHPVISTLKILKENGVSEILLIGSLYTMKSAYMNTIFKANNITIKRPSDVDMQFIDNVRKEVYLGNKSLALLKKYNALISKYAINNNLVIACTEWSIANKTPHVYDMVQIQISKAISIYNSK